MILKSSNSIGFVRLCLALLVILCHTFIYNNSLDPLDRLSQNQRALGSVAVDGFFFLSGYLITSSYLRIDNLPRYCWHRCLRILPGLWVCLLVVGLGLPLLFGQPPNIQYFLNNWWLVLRVEAEGSWDMPYEYIPGVFEGGFMNGLVNGVTWTLGHEFRCYAAIGLLGVFGILRQHRHVVLSLFFLLWGLEIFHFLTHNNVESRSLWVMTHFAIGSVFYLYREQIPWSGWIVAAWGVIGAIALRYGGYIFVSPFVTAYLLLWLSNHLPFLGWERRADYSYGLYIYAAPIQHCLSTWGFWRWGWLPFFLFSVVCTLPFAAASWHLVEKPALIWKNALLKQPKVSLK